MGPAGIGHEWDCRICESIQKNQCVPVSKDNLGASLNSAYIAKGIRGALREETI